MIRSHFEEIHRSYSFDEPLAMVPVPKHPGLIVGYDKLLAYEKAGELKIKELFNGEPVELEVRELLNGVDLQEARKPGSLHALPPVLQLLAQGRGTAGRIGGSACASSTARPAGGVVRP